MRPGDQIEVEASGLHPSGAGLADRDGLVLHVADLLPGERALVRVETLSRHHPRGYARLVRRLGPPSTDRESPPCPAFGQCGGCPWQHLSYPGQLAHKQRRVARALADAGVSAAPEPVVPAPSITGYRNKGKYVVGAGPVVGAYVPRSHRVVSTLGCQVVAPAIDRIASRARDAIARAPITPYDEARRAGQLRYLIVRADPDDRVLVGLVTTSATPADAVAAVADGLADAPGLAGVVWLTNDETSGALLAGAARPGDPTRPEPPSARTLFGAPTLREPLGPASVDLDVTAFFQINRDQAARLYATLAERVGAGPETRAVDLYCGVGGVSFALARTGAAVTGIEQHRPAVAAASRAARAAGLSRVEFRSGDAGDLAGLPADQRPDLVVVNPPRKGLTPEVIRALLAAAPPTLAYVSCEPTTLGRDLAALVPAYRVRELLPFDLMPGTSKVETLVICDR